MSGIRVEGDTSGNVLEVDANKNAKVNLPTTPSQAGYARLVGGDNDKVKVLATGYPAVSLESLEFFDTVDGAAINTNLWNQSVSTMTVTQAAGFINLNPTNSIATSVHSIISSIQTFYLTSCLPLHVHLDLQASLWNLPANTLMEFGWMTCATTAAPTDGVFVRAVAGSSYLVASYGGSETVTAFTLPAAATTNEYVLDIYAETARLFIDKVLVATVTMPTSQPSLVAANRQPISLRVYNQASAPGSSPTMKLGQISVQQRNAQFNKPYADKLVGIGRSAIQSPITTFAQTANYANSAAPASATLSNTAAGYTTLGGQFQFAAVAGAETDYALFGFQVPAGYQLYVQDVRIAAFNMVVAVATTPTLLQWALGVNSSAVSLATADGAGTWAPRKTAIGSMSFAVAAPVGAQAVDPIAWSPGVPLCVEGGRWLHVILKMPVATATATEIIRGTVAVHGYFE